MHALPSLGARSCTARTRSARRSIARTRAMASRIEKRLRNVVVCPELQPHDSLHFVGLRREHEYRHGRALADETAHLESIEARQHDIEDHGARRWRSRQCDARVAAVGREHHESVTLEVVLQSSAHVGSSSITRTRRLAPTDFGGAVATISFQYHRRSPRGPAEAFDAFTADLTSVGPRPA